jgi:thiol-disulfide isomerase/thioredoxin
MKINSIKILSIAIAIFPLFAHSQSASHRLTVGDKAPEFKPYSWIKGAPVEELKKGEVYIIEFGSTWCAPCAAAIPKLTALANKYRGNITVISTFVMEFNKNSPDKAPGYLDKVNSYIARRSDQIGYTIAVDGPTRAIEKTWLEAAGLNGIPHTFIVNKEGRIAWIGNNPDGIDSEIDNALTGFKVETDIISADRSALISPKTDDTLLFSSALWKYRAGQADNANSPFISSYLWAAPGSVESSKQGKIYITGESLRRLYYMAYADTLWNYPLMMSPKTGTYPDSVKNPYQRRSYGKWWYRPILEIKDSSLFESNYNSVGNRFNYLLKVPKNLATANFMKKAMQRDLQTYFNYEVTVEEKFMPCWLLITSDKNKKKLLAKSPGQTRSHEDNLGNYHYFNGQMRDIIFQLEIKYGYGPEGALVFHPNRQPPFIDASGITGQIDYTITAPFAKRILEQYSGGEAFTFDDYREMLQSIGIELVRDQRKMKVVIIRDKVTAD